VKINYTIAQSEPEDCHYKSIRHKISKKNAEGDEISANRLFLKAVLYYSRLLPDNEVHIAVRRILSEILDEGRLFGFSRNERGEIIWSEVPNEGRLNDSDPLNKEKDGKVIPFDAFDFLSTEKSAKGILYEHLCKDREKSGHERRMRIFFPDTVSRDGICSRLLALKKDQITSFTEPLPQDVIDNIRMLVSEGYIEIIKEDEFPNEITNDGKTRKVKNYQDTPNQFQNISIQVKCLKECDSDKISFNGQNEAVK
jgi:hypothetical protein